MKILHIMAGRGQGGAETYSTDVMLSLHEQGVDQIVVMAEDAPRFAALQKAGLRMAPAILQPRLRLFQRWRLKRLIAKERSDIIQCWMRRAASLLPARLDSEFERGPQVIGWFGGYYDPAHFKACGTFVGVTEGIRQHMIDHGVPQGSARYIPTFPEIESKPPADRMQMATPRDAKVLLTLSRLHPKKGLDTMLQALASLQDCYLWLAGDGPLRRQLLAQAEKLGVAGRVRFLGWRTDRAALLRAADICVLPSRYEPFGTVILEAWAAGTPLVACASQGPKAHIRDGVNGMLVPVDDATGLAVTIRRVLHDQNLRRALVAEGYATYVKNFTREAVTKQWLAFYNSINGTGERIGVPSPLRAGLGAGYIKKADTGSNGENHSPNLSRKGRGISPV